MADLTKKYSDNNINQGAVVAVQQDSPSKLTDYYFDVIRNHTISINNQITDYYLENNTAVQDHIAHAPIVISLSGISGEIVYKQAQADVDYERELQQAVAYSNMQNLDNKLATLSVLHPSSSNTTQKAMNAYDYISASANRYIGILRRFRNSNEPLNEYNGTSDRTFKETRLQEIYRKFMLLRSNNTALWVHTPYGDFLNMYIQSITLRQNEENFVTDIEMTLKQLNFVEVKYTKVDEKVMSKYNAYARAQQQENGKANTESSLLKSATDAMGITEKGSGIVERN